MVYSLTSEWRKIHNTCWLCGKKGFMTRHHVINQCLNPVKNEVIPLCTRCHRYIHSKQPQHIKQPRQKMKILKIQLKRKKHTTQVQKLVNELNMARKKCNKYEGVIMGRYPIDSIVLEHNETKQQKPEVKYVRM